MKRLSGWHQGRNVGRRSVRSPLPDVGSGADPTSAAPEPLRYGPGKRMKSTDRL